jgi:hypothetical protein
MSSLAELYIKEETLETLLKTVRAKGEKGVAITISISDTTSQHGSNITSYVSQTKEQREAKKDKFTVGYGKVFWTDGNITKAEPKKTEVPNQEAERQPEPQQSTTEDDDLPF